MKEPNETVIFKYFHQIPPSVRAMGGKVVIENGEYTSTGTALDSPATYRYSLDCFYLQHCSLFYDWRPFRLDCNKHECQ